MRKIRFENDDIAACCLELNYLLHAGIGNAEALRCISEDEDRKEFSELFASMADGADEGKMLSEVFRDAGVFPGYVYEMIAVGEKTGRTEEALKSLANDAQSRANLDRQTKSALVYPSVLLLVMLVVVAVLLIYVLPVFNDVYSQLGSGLTGVAGVLLTVGGALGRVSWLLVILLCAAVAFLAAFSAVPAFREKVIGRMEKRRGDKGAYSMINTARFAQALSLGMSSGLDAQEAVSSALTLLNENKVSSERGDRCRELIESGSNLAQALRESGLMPAKQCRELEAGIKGGSGDLAMEQIAQRLTDDAENALSEQMSRIEPTIVIVSSILVGIILLAVMLPLVNIMNSIG